MPLPFVPLQSSDNPVVTAEEYLRKCLLHTEDAYRGQGSNTWSLVPGAFRTEKGDLASQAERERRLKYFDSYKFTIDFDRLNGSIDGREKLDLKTTGYAKLQRTVLFQHMGIPTPLLDWTYSSLVALFMAYAFRPAGSSCLRIYRLKLSILPNELMFQNYERIGFERIKRQMGGISFFGSIEEGSESIRVSSMAFSEFIEDSPESEFVERVDVNVDHVEARIVRNALDSNGFTLETMFPGSSYWVGRAIASQLPWLRS